MLSIFFFRFYVIMEIAAFKEIIMVTVKRLVMSLNSAANQAVLTPTLIPICMYEFMCVHAAVGNLGWRFPLGVGPWAKEIMVTSHLLKLLLKPLQEYL